MPQSWTTRTSYIRSFFINTSYSSLGSKRRFQKWNVRRRWHNQQVHVGIFSFGKENEVFNAFSSFFWCCDLPQSESNIFYSCLHVNVKRIKLITQYHIIHCFICPCVYWRMPMPVAARSMEWVCGPLPAGIAGSNRVGFWMSVSLCHVLSGLSDWSLVQRSPTECSVSECDRETSTMRRPGREEPGCSDKCW